VPRVWCGIDWARHHDVALANDDGQILGKQRISDDVEGPASVVGVPCAPCREWSRGVPGGDRDRRRVCWLLLCGLLEERCIRSTRCRSPVIGIGIRRAGEKRRG
jgi:hypothetical protein